MKVRLLQSMLYLVVSQDFSYLLSAVSKISTCSSSNGCNASGVTRGGAGGPPRVTPSRGDTRIAAEVRQNTGKTTGGCFDETRAEKVIT